MFWRQIRQEDVSIFFIKASFVETAHPLSSLRCNRKCKSLNYITETIFSILLHMHKYDALSPWLKSASRLWKKSKLQCVVYLQWYKCHARSAFKDNLGRLCKSIRFCWDKQKCVFQRKRARFHRYGMWLCAESVSIVVVHQLFKCHRLQVLMFWRGYHNEN